MISWEIYYYNGSLPLVKVTSQEMSWQNVPIDGVIKIKITKNGYSQILQGMDHYWINGNEFGSFNSIGNTAIQEAKTRERKKHKEIYYSGLTAVYYNWDNNELISNKEQFPVDSTKILNGIMIPDLEAIKLGILN